MSKRSRVGTASNLASDTDVINYVTQPQCHPAPIATTSNKPSLGFGREVSRVFTLGSPEREHACVGDDRVELFLEQCFYCKKQIDHTMDVFMYREHAFCKTVCRYIQIIMDDMNERVAAPKRKAVD